jgi:hypothetical protein
VVAQPGIYLLAIGDIDTGGRDLNTEAFDRPDRADGREVRVVFGQCQPSASRRNAASAQQRDVACSAFGQVGGHNAAERSCTASHDIGRIRGQLGGKRSCQAAARAQSWDERRSAADRDLIFGPVVEKVLADACGGFSAVVGVIDVDDAAPVFGEFLVADDSTETPDSGLVDGTQLGSGSRLRVRGDQVKAGLYGVVLRECLHEA